MTEGFFALPEEGGYLKAVAVGRGDKMEKAEVQPYTFSRPRKRGNRNERFKKKRNPIVSVRVSSDAEGKNLPFKRFKAPDTYGTKERKIKIPRGRVGP